MSSDVVRGRVVAERPDGTVLIAAPITDRVRFDRQKVREYWVQPIDSRKLSDSQRNMCYALLGFIPPEKQKEHFTQEDYLAGSPAAPPLYLVFAYEEKPPATASKGTFHSGKGTFYSGIGTFHSGKGTFYSGKIFFSTPEKPSNSKAFRAFCSRSKNPNI